MIANELIEEAEADLDFEDVEGPPVSMLDYPAHAVRQPRDCDVCRTLMPAGWIAAVLESGELCCCSTCIAAATGPEGNDIEEILERARDLEGEAEGLEEEAQELRDKADELRSRYREIKKIREVNNQARRRIPAGRAG